MSRSTSFYLIAVIILFLFLFSVVSAQIDDVKDKITDTTQSLQNNITKAKEFTQADTWDFIGQQWKEIFLKNKYIAGINAAFTKVDIVFIVLFDMHWKISLDILFAFLLWLFTLLSLMKYITVENKWLRFLYSFLGVLGLSQLHIFSYLAVQAVAFTFSKTSFYWRMLFIVVIFVAITLWYKINSLVAKSLEMRRESKRKSTASMNEQKIEKVVEGLDGK